MTYWISFSRRAIANYNICGQLFPELLQNAWRTEGGRERERENSPIRSLHVNNSQSSQTCNFDFSLKQWNSVSDYVQWSAMSKVDNPASAYRSMASTASSRLIRPQPPLVCHIPFRTRQMSKESFPLPSLIRRFSTAISAEHLTEFLPTPCNSVRVVVLMDSDRLRLGNRWLW